MRSFFSTFYGKISTIFMILLVVLGAAQVMITVQSCISFMEEAEYKVSLPLVEKLAVDLQPYMENGIDRASIERAIGDVLVLHPDVEVYILNESGRILEFFMGPGKTLAQQSVDIHPVSQFIESSGGMPMKGDYPCHPDCQKVFAAAPVNIGGSNGYLYAIYGNEHSHTALGMVLDTYVGRATLKVVLFTLFFAGLIGLTLFSLVTKRFNRMTEAVQKFEQGDLNQRIKIQANDEIGQLAGAFNQMADTIVSNIDEMKTKDKLRRDLVANISHDLRSPLASIQGYLETILMREPKLPEEKRRKLLETIFNNARQLSKLVSELFELSKLDARQTQPKPEPFSLAELIQDVALKFKPRAEKQNIDLKVKFPKKLPFVYGDIGMIERAVSNLMDNALNYTPEDGSVTVELKESPDNKIAIKISDTGKGIPPEDIPFVFERFYRVEKSRTRSANSGAGLGLAITKKIIEAHNSGIFVESAENKGTSFAFELPVHA